MTMYYPTPEDMERIAHTLPGDEIYPKVKPHVDAINDKEPEIRRQIKELIFKDMAFDLALARAVEEASPVVEYLSRSREHNPDFTAEALFRTFSRISRFKASLEILNIVDIPEELRGMLIRAEVDRLWGEHSGKKQIVIGQQQPQQPAVNLDSVKQEIIASIKSVKTDTKK